ncbi:alpha/beta fold hydrolase [Ramlibacter sp. USB13]|uniref:Alpha/beta fold hydrolase n=1 Tax=Ramlibacter cellulosilyticus TaxID=2764187 RepID=A0A923MRY5_9BURK|nr:alpha/beta hydrolase [Ramlibacter cellulosilyticus]MBC5784385.1 alpha/beta fold hydrolase [Ramlibacter cellulosilyticus]
MASVRLDAVQVNYELAGARGRPVITFLNGLTQNANLWTAYADYFVPRGWRVLAYDMLGQGRSSKPVVDIPFAAHADLLARLLDTLGIAKTHLAGISFGGVIALDFAIRHGERLESLVAMSTFAELTPQLEFLGTVMLQGLIEAGFPYMQSMLYPMNMSSAWIAANRERIPAMKRSGYIGNDGYAMQNLMESFVAFRPLTPHLHRIAVPTLVMNGEFDFFTPRECHDLIRSHVANSRLVIVQRAYHAFTLEMPAVTMRQIGFFLGQVRDGDWVGDQSVWAAAENPAAHAQWLPILGDWRRAIQVAPPEPPPVRTVVRAPARSQSRRTAAARAAAKP